MNSLFAKVFLLAGAAHLASAAHIASAAELTQSIKNASKTIAENIVKRYTDQPAPIIPGLFPDTTNGGEAWYWFGDGVTWDSLIYYWAETGDDQFNELIQTGLYWQTGADYDFMPPNQTRSEGNDDQAAWAFAAMTAAEQGFPQPASQNVSYFQLAQNVFDSQAARWDDQHCDGGLRWQIFAFNTGYNYKNSLANGGFYQLAARLAHFSGNKTYYDWAQKTMQWSMDVGFVQKDAENGGISVYDGASSSDNCSSINKTPWSNNLATYLQGAAYLYNTSMAGSGNDSSIDLIDGLITTIGNLFTANESNILIEAACAEISTCDATARTFLGALARAMAATQHFVPSTSNKLLAIIDETAAAAAKACPDRDVCDYNWTGDGQSISKFDLGTDLSTLNALVAALPMKQPLTSDDGTNVSSGSSSTTSPGNNGTTSGGGSPTTQGNSTSITPPPGNGAATLAGSGVLAVGMAFAMVLL